MSLFLRLIDRRYVGEGVPASVGLPAGGKAFARDPVIVGVESVGITLWSPFVLEELLCVFLELEVFAVLIVLGERR